MAWRVVEHAGRRWQVTVAAERRANATQYTLVFAFRATPPDHRSIWVTFPLSSPSRAALFARAERLADDELTAILAEHVE